eukprot:TRINITY_DN45716_c0_g2_i1.p1 TRINITY_DN45716_c0_g2~~TRINITY_DN45716_c0_g2_i1.p1  ORF type:complete len:113 (+),score=29.43 TRINITY_DN45716_c0_g2_i1:42-380(+)
MYVTCVLPKIDVSYGYKRWCCFFFFKQKTAYEMLRSLVGSEMCIRDRYQRRVRGRELMRAHRLLAGLGSRPGDLPSHGHSLARFDNPVEHSIPHLPQTQALTPLHGLSLIHI